ncbi:MULTISPECIES: sulfite exporter TauE/SafE family protein [unclassified Pseudoalteromonas]|uniref:sulfite exporter TauE/SafE family protein n=1 Tax=unclassified Pseudoalteromonas TaxID=194690 RepID=UPI0025B28D1D|nr:MULTISPECIES: sulfite exporter TauE/SafE family protein [unclassified Pseudoalteromonas]MDN3377024.1 sulfite exporter TauE/SafE family protein [Pseudoalteromonas sp. APC 3893]MDN3388530.1 sulfite exporter TauE/SafE family protein [Pseudoalteromonas sp. APC 4017]
MEFLAGDLLTPFSVIGLIVLSAITSMVSAAFGAGGGLLLLVVMASLLPMSIVIPVHGLVQLGSNANRFMLTFKHLDKSMFVYFSLGGVLGVFAASSIVAHIPLELMKIVVAGFVLYLLWGVTPKLRETSKLWRYMAGAVTTFLSMFVGASGPLVGSCLYVNNYDKLRYTATFSACMSVQHTFKAILYGFVGFSFWQWLPLVTAMIISGVLGTWLGLKLLQRISAAKFKAVFRAVLTLLALQLAWQGFQGL